jgi:hypothetical protein
MSSFEEVETNIFADLVHQIDGIDVSGIETDCPVVLKDGAPVRLNPLAGDDLRQALITAYGEARHRYASTTAVSSSETEFVQQSIYGELERLISADDQQTGLALEGSDYYHLGVNQGHIGVARLSHDERLFGTVAGVKVDEFLTLCPGGVGESGRRSIEPNPTHLWGGMVILENAELCERNGAGVVRMKFNRLTVPIHPNGFTWSIPETLVA